jgi:hypothetical protein
MTKPKLALPQRPKAKRLDSWVEYPAKPSTCPELHTHYNEVVQLAKKDPVYKKYLGGDLYYLVAYRHDTVIRRFVCDNYKDCGFDVRTSDINIYARIK